MVRSRSPERIRHPRLRSKRGLGTIRFVGEKGSGGLDGDSASDLLGSDSRVAWTEASVGPEDTSSIAPPTPMTTTPVSRSRRRAKRTPATAGPSPQSAHAVQHTAPWDSSGVEGVHDEEDE